MSAAKKVRAAALLEKAAKAGCVATLQGNFTVFTPPPPIELMMESIELGNELAAILKEKEAKP